MLAALLLALLALASMTPQLSVCVNVDLRGDGSALITHEVTLLAPVDEVEVKLLSRPSGFLVAYSGGGPLTVDVVSNESGWYALIPFPPESFELTYASLSLANYSSGTWTVRVSSDYVASIKLPPEVVPTYIPDDAIDISAEDGRYVITLPPGEHVVEYVVLVEPPTGGGWPWHILAVAVAAPIALLVALRALHRRASTRALDDVDRSIIDLVRRRGPLTVSEVSEVLGLPKSTAHRRLSKLAKWGLIKLRKVHGRLVAELD